MPWSPRHCEGIVGYTTHGSGCVSAPSHSVIRTGTVELEFLRKNAPYRQSKKDFSGTVCNSSHNVCP